MKNRIKIGSSTYFILIVMGVVLLSASIATQAFGLEKRLRLSCSAQIAEAFGKDVLKILEKETGLETQLHVFSSTTCINRLINGVAELATTTQGLSYSLKQQGFIEIPFCRDPLAIIVQQDLPVDNIDETQLRNIFSRKVTNWKSVGGPNIPIILIVPGTETGAYVNFKHQVMRIDEIRFDFMTEKSTMAIEGVKNMPGAISFVAQGATNKVKGIKALRINNLAHTDPGYLCFQTFSFVTKGKPNAIARDVINFAVSKKGLEIMKLKGMKPVIQ